MESSYLFPNIPIGYLPYVQNLLYPSRSYRDDPITNQIFAIAWEGIDGGTYCSKIDPPTIKVDSVEIKQNNMPFSIFVPTRVDVGTFTLHRALHVGGDGVEAPRPNNIVLAQWVQEVVDARLRTKTSTFRKTAFIKVYDNSGNTSRMFIAHECIPVEYTPFSVLDGTNPDICMESITLQPEGWEVID